MPVLTGRVRIFSKICLVAVKHQSQSLLSTELSI